MRRTLVLTTMSLLLSGLPVFAQTLAPSRGWIGVDLVRLQSAQKAQTFTWSGREFGEIGTATTAYPALPGITGMKVAGGIGIRGGLGFALGFSSGSYDSIVGLGVRVPSPFFFNTFASAINVTDKALRRRDRAIDLSAVYAVPTPEDRLQIHVFGGPSHFNVTNDMVEDVSIIRTASFRIPVNSVVIDGYSSKKVSGSAWGFNVGADTAWFFTRYVGLGGGVRLNRGTVTVLEPNSVENQDLNVGHAEFSGGLRLRF
jgi:hypothetical protein